MGSDDRDPAPPPAHPPPLPTGTTIQIGDPVHVGGARPWVCIGKVRMRAYDADRGAPEEGEPSETGFIRTGFGGSAMEAREDVIAQLSRSYGPPTRSIARWVGFDPAIETTPGFWSRLFRR